MKNKLIILFSFCLLAFNTMAQTDTSHIEPKIGKACPDFVLRNIKYYSKKQATLKDFRGKWLLLDFWDKQCNACIASFPHMNALQKEFSNQLQVMLIGIEDKEKEIEPLYARFRKKENLVIPCGFDSLLANRFVFYTVPYNVLVDDSGIVRHIGKVDAEDIKGYLTGHPPIQIPDDAMVSYDPEKPFLIYGNGGKDTDYLFRSVLSEWKPGVNRLYPTDMISHENIEKGRFQTLGVSLEVLYRFAYFGKVNWDYNDTTLYRNVYLRPVLEISDSSVFQSFYKTGKNVFSYALQMPPANCTIERMQGIMQRDLFNYFGFEARVETEKKSCWKLTATDEAKRKLKTKGGPQYLKGSVKISYKAQNIPFNNFLAFIQYLNANDIILDGTGITSNIDITMDCKDCVMTNIKDVKRALQINGLDLVPTEKEMKVLFIRDGKPKAK